MKPAPCREEPGQHDERESPERLERASGRPLGARTHREEHDCGEEPALGTREHREPQRKPGRPGGAALDEDPRERIERKRDASGRERRLHTRERPSHDPGLGREEHPQHERCPLAPTEPPSQPHQDPDGEEMAHEAQGLGHPGEVGHGPGVGGRRHLDGKHLPREREEEHPERARRAVGRLPRVEGEALPLDEVLRELEMDEGVVGEVVEKGQERRRGGEEKQEEERAGTRVHVPFIPAPASAAPSRSRRRG